jgi:cytoskeletal protein CcmA (bactofilin family)
MENNQGLNLSELTIIASDITLNGTLEVSREVHVYGKIVGEIRGNEGSTILIKEGAHIEGKIFSSSLIIDGFVKGEIEATQKVWITARGRLLGSVKTPSLQVDPGAIFEAKVKM